MKTNNELITEGVQHIKRMLKNTDFLELEFTSTLHVTRSHNIIEGIKEELNKLSAIEKNIFYKSLQNGNMLVTKNIKLLDYYN